MCCLGDYKQCFSSDSNGRLAVKKYQNNFGIFGVTIDRIEKNWPQGIFSYFHQLSAIYRAEHETVNDS